MLQEYYRNYKGKLRECYRNTTAMSAYSLNKRSSLQWAKFVTECRLLHGSSLTSPTSGGRSADIVRPRPHTTEFSFISFSTQSLGPHYKWEYNIKMGLRGKEWGDVVSCSAGSASSLAKQLTDSHKMLDSTASVSYYL
jgi:hypothetical protein